MRPILLSDAHYAGEGIVVNSQHSPFVLQIRDHQIAWRRKSGTGICLDYGWQNGRRYPWTLPAAQWEQNLWPGIRSGTANSLPAYLKRNRIQSGTAASTI